MQEYEILSKKHNDSRGRQVNYSTRPATAFEKLLFLATKGLGACFPSDLSTNPQVQFVIVRRVAERKFLNIQILILQSYFHFRWKVVKTRISTAIADEKSESFGNTLA